MSGVGRRSRRACGELTPAPSAPVPSAEGEPTPSPPAEAKGRLVVFLFQKDFFEPGRLKGLVHIEGVCGRLRAEPHPPRPGGRAHLRFTIAPLPRLHGRPSASRRGASPRPPARRAGGNRCRCRPLTWSSASIGTPPAERPLPRKASKSWARPWRSCPGRSRWSSSARDLGDSRPERSRWTSTTGPARQALERSRTAVFALDVSQRRLPLARRRPPAGGPRHQQRVLARGPTTLRWSP